MATYNKNIKDKLYSYFKLRLGMRDYRRNWLKGNCPYCGKKDKFGVNISLNRCNCFYCGPKKPPFWLVMDLEKLTNKYLVFKLLEEQEKLEYKEIGLDTTLKEIKNIKLPEGFKLLNSGDNQLAISARNYIKKRGFNPKEMALKGWGYGTTGKYRGYIIIPIFFKDKLVYFTSRRFIGNGPKFMNLEMDEDVIGKNMVLYNYEALFMYDKVRLVESVMNAETLGDNTIASNGKKLSSYQLNLIIKSPCTHVTVLLDRDAFDDSIKLALDLIQYKQIKLVQFPDDRDVNDLGKKETLKLIYKSKYLTYGKLLNLKNERSFYTYNSKPAS